MNSKLTNPRPSKSSGGVLLQSSSDLALSIGHEFKPGLLPRTFPAVTPQMVRALWGSMFCNKMTTSLVSWIECWVPINSPQRGQLAPRRPGRLRGCRQS
jgi:hypothetical protein